MKQCLTCGCDFIPYSNRQKCCCRECSDAHFATERREAVKRFREQQQEESRAS
jgi:hypothetical protein